MMQDPAEKLSHRENILARAVSTANYVIETARDTRGHFDEAAAAFRLHELAAMLRTSGVPTHRIAFPIAVARYLRRYEGVVV